MPSGLPVRNFRALLRLNHVSFIRLDQGLQGSGACYDFFDVHQQLVAHMEGRGVANADLFSGRIQRCQRKRIFQYNNPGLHGLMGVGGHLLAVVGELLATGLALEPLFSTLDAFADKHRIMGSAARPG